jgi:hypothetical protein
MVKKEYPELEKYYGKKQEQIIYSIRHLQEKSTHQFYDYVHDQGSMVAFIDELYPKKKDGERTKKGKKAQQLAKKLFLRFEKMC